MTEATLTWWSLLRSVAVLNVLAWSLMAIWLWRERGRWPPDAWLGRRGQLLLSAGYVLSLGVVWPRLHAAHRPALAGMGLAASVYVVYMFAVDVPMYWSRWVADQAAGRAYLGLAQGVADAATRWEVSHRWSQWRSEVIWMSVYFSVAVWMSIAMVRAAPLRPAAPRSVPQ